MNAARRLAPLVVAFVVTLAGRTARAEDGAPAPPNTDAYARFWIGVSGALDFLYLPSATDVCRETPSGHPANGEGFYCTAPNGTDFPSAMQNTHLSAAGDAGRVHGTVEPGDVRVMIAADYALLPNFLLGARLGYVLNAYPGNAAVGDGHALGPKIHAEVRATYVFGHNPLGHEGFAGMAFVGGGVSELDGHATTSVTFDDAAGQQPAVAWLTSSPFFFVVGGGARYQFSSRVAFTAAARFNGSIGGGFLPTLGPEVTLQYGF